MKKLITMLMIVCGLCIFSNNSYASEKRFNIECETNSNAFEICILTDLKTGDNFLIIRNYRASGGVGVTPLPKNPHYKGGK